MLDCINLCSCSLHVIDWLLPNWLLLDRLAIKILDQVDSLLATIIPLTGLTVRFWLKFSRSTNDLDAFLPPVIVYFPPCWQRNTCVRDKLPSLSFVLSHSTIALGSKLSLTFSHRRGSPSKLQIKRL